MFGLGIQEFLVIIIISLGNDFIRLQYERINSKTSGFFLCGMMLLPVVINIISIQVAARVNNVAVFTEIIGTVLFGVLLVLMALGNNLLQRLPVSTSMLGPTPRLRVTTLRRVSPGRSSISC